MSKPTLNCDWYPGHCFIETALFQQDANTKTITCRSIVHKRNLPGDQKDQIIELPVARQNTVIRPVLRNSLQTVQFVGVAPGGPNGEEQEADRMLLRDVFETYRFPLDHVRFALQSSSLEIGQHLVGEENEIQCKDILFYVKGSRFLAIWRYESTTNTTTLVLVNFAPPQLELVTQFHLFLASITNPIRQCFGHPMFPALLITEVIRQDSMRAYQADSLELREIENEVTVKSANRISTMQTLRDLGRMSFQDRFILLALKQALELSLDINRKHFEACTSTEDQSIAEHFLLHTDRYIRLINLDMAFLDSIIGSVTHQQAAITTIINMTDGASMKTIAVLTLFFLPSTFIATLFSMPSFPTVGVASQFWLYWAVTIPLTMTVVILWLGWWYWHVLQRYYDDPSRSPLEDLSAWTNHFFTGKKWKKEDVSSYQVRRKLKGDTYKEWITKFNRGVWEQAGKEVSEKDTGSLKTSTGEV